MGVLSNLFGDNKKVLLEKKCKELLGANLKWATNWCQTMAVRFSVEDASFLMEMDTFFYALVDCFLRKNCVDKNTRQELFKFFKTKNKDVFMKPVPIEYHDDFTKRINKRIEDYTNIFNHYNDVTDNCLEEIMEYQSILFLEVFTIRNHFVKINELNKELHEYFREIVKELMNIGYFKNLVDEYFTNKKHKLVYKEE
jgi:hypothetical protein